MTQKPSIGRIIIVPAVPAENNGATLAPAVITRVWNDTTVNVRVLLDGDETQWRTSITLFQTPEEMWDTHTSQQADTPPHAGYWPPRV